MAPYSRLCLTLLSTFFFLLSVQTSVISDHFKNRVLVEQVVDQSVNHSLEPEDMMTHVNGGTLPDFFHSYSVLEEDKSDVAKEPEGDGTSELIYVQDFLNLTDYDLPSPRAISPKFKGNAENPQVEDDVTKVVEDRDQYHEHPSVEFVSDVIKNKMNEATKAPSEVQASSQSESKVKKESSQPADSSPTSESTDLVTPPVLSSPSPPSSMSTFPPTLESSSTSDSAPPPVFSPPAASVPLQVIQPASESSSPEYSSTESSPPAMATLLRPQPGTEPGPLTIRDGVDDDADADSLDNLFLELENLNSLNEAVEALNQGPFDDSKAEDRTDVIDDGYGGDEADDFLTELYNWFG